MLAPGAVGHRHFEQACCKWHRSHDVGVEVGIDGVGPAPEVFIPTSDASDPRLPAPPLASLTSEASLIVVVYSFGIEKAIINAATAPMAHH